MKKKILIFQLKGNSNGGIWYVNETLSKTFVKKGYESFVLSFRNNPGPTFINTNQVFKMQTVNPKDRWGETRLSHIKNSFKKHKFIETFKLIIKKSKEELILRKDFKKSKKIIKDYNPDYIICSFYQILNGIPKKYLKKTIIHQHTSFESTLRDQPKASKFFTKYKDKVAKFVWLTKSTCESAIKYGYKNSTYIYNPIRFESNDKANVNKNKKLVTISRLTDPQKRIDLMLDIAKDVLEKHKDWILELYGDSNLEEKELKIIKKCSQIKLMGRTKEVKEKLLSSSIYLSTSFFEGLPLSIIEAYEVGVPTVSYTFGESSQEVVLNNKTGYLIPFNDKKMYEEKLLFLMENKDILEKFSNNAKEYAETFHTEKIIKKWLQLLETIDRE